MPARPKVSLSTIVREWGRIGCIGFGGPPTHVALLRHLCIDERRWMSDQEFEDGIAAANVLPGPMSTQLAIFCAWRLRGALGGLIGGICFIVPGLVLILAMASVVLSPHPPSWILGAAVGASAAVPAVAVRAAVDLIPASWRRVSPERSQVVRWLAYVLLGGGATVAFGRYLVVVLVLCGLTEVATRSPRRTTGRSGLVFVPAIAGHGIMLGALGALVWVAFKVGALSYGGGFVIIPLMQHDAVTTYHWMTGGQFLNAVALGQLTPGPVVQTVAVVGYAARGVVGGLLAAAVAFTPSFLFVLLGAPRFDRIRRNGSVQAFLAGAGPCAVGAIAGSAVSLGRAFQHQWQIPVLGGALLWLLAARRSIVSSIVLAGLAGVVLWSVGVTT